MHEVGPVFICQVGLVHHVKFLVVVLLLCLAELGNLVCHFEFVQHLLERIHLSHFFLHLLLLVLNLYDPILSKRDFAHHVWLTALREAGRLNLLRDQQALRVLLEGQLLPAADPFR